MASNNASSDEVSQLKLFLKLLTLKDLITNRNVIQFKNRQIHDYCFPFLEFDAYCRIFLSVLYVKKLSFIFVLVDSWNYLPLIFNGCQHFFFCFELNCLMKILMVLFLVLFICLQLVSLIPHINHHLNYFEENVSTNDLTDY